MAFEFSAAVDGFILGGGLILAIGAQNAYVLKMGLLRRHVFLICLVCALTDAVLIALGAGGFGALVSANTTLQSIAAWGGAAFLFVYGLRAFWAALRPGAMDVDAAAATITWQSALTTVLAVSLLNPHVYLDTVVLVGSIAGQYAPAARLSFAIGAMTASFVWFFGLGYGARILTPIFERPSAWRVLDIFVGFVMWWIAFALISDRLAG